LIAIVADENLQRLEGSTVRLRVGAIAHRVEEVPAMLPPFIIEEIRRRENSQRHRYEQPQLELPIPVVTPNYNPPVRRDDDDRGVTIIDL